MKLHLIVSVLLIGGATLWAADQAVSATYKTDAELMSVLKQSIQKVGPAMATSGVVNADKYQVNVVHRDKPAGAIAHPEGTEVHYIIDGGGTFVTGGKITGKAAAAVIEGGVTRHVAKGDVVVIPAGMPHWYSEIDKGSITYLETRFNIEAKQ
jgi:mannose-6-phosphate isomerase-like protein (cupin superfamily)